MTMAVSPRHALEIRDAEKSAESLFESQSIAQIREVETKARTDIEDKKQQLRQLVGSSYRDLIDSADTILSMTTCCQSALSRIVSIQDDFASLTASASTAIQAKSHKKASGSQREQLFAVGSRVKYLVDTSELLWGCLDTQDYLEAAHRFLRASEVYRLLQDTATASMGRFPLLRNQWSSVQAFRAQVTEGVQQRLQSHASLTVKDAAEALAATSFLQQLTSIQALELFLKCCRHRAMQPLTAAANQDLSEAQLTSLLLQLADSVQSVVTQVGELFLTPPASAGQPLLLSTISEDMSSSELLFSPLPGQEHSQEAHAWQDLRKATIDRLAPLQQQHASTACRTWLGQLAGDLQRQCPALMPACATTAGFAALESHLQTAILHWQPLKLASAGMESTLAGTPKLPLTTPRPSPWTPRPSPLAAKAKTPFEDPEQATAPETWEGICDWVLGGRLDLWQQLFEEPFLQHAKELIKASYKQSSQDFQQPFTDCLNLAKQAPPAAPGGFYATQWPEHAVLEAESSLIRTASRHTGFNSRSYQKRKRSHFGDGQAEQSGDSSAGWRAQVGEVSKGVDNQLRQAFQGSLLLLGKQDQKESVSGYESASSSQAAARAGQSAGAGAGAGVSGRAQELRPFIQQQCNQAVQDMAAVLSQQLQGLGQPSMDLEGGKLVEQALLIARLSHLLGYQTQALQTILGPFQGWQSVLPHSTGALPGGSGPLREAPSGRAAGKSPDKQQLKQLQHLLREVTMKAYEVWALWAGQGLCLELQSALETDAAFTSLVALQAWEETVVAQEDGMDEGIGEMRFKLPASASPGALLFLLAGCREVARAGAHFAGPAAIRLLQWHLSHAVLQAFGAVFQAGGRLNGKASEKGLLQLLFDVRYLSDALSGGQPLGDPHTHPQATPSSSRAQAGQGRNASPAVLERRQGFESLESMLGSQLDPIDWATYEPYLWSNEATYYQRAGTVFGILLQTRRIHSQVMPKPATSFEANILTVAQTAPRFSYLPISNPALNPAALRRGAAGAPQTAALGAVAGTLASSSRPFEVLDQTGSYSFANINVGRAVSATSAEQRAVQSAESTALQALQSKFAAGTTGTSQRLGAFGSLLGDKATEITAMASQSLGDYVPTAFPSGLASSGLSGFTSGASGLLAGFKGFRNTNAS